MGPRLTRRRCIRITFRRCPVAPERVAQVGGLVHPQAGDRGRRGPGRHDREVKPRRRASASRRSSPATGRTSAARPSSPITTSPVGSGMSRADDQIARASARSAAGSVGPGAADGGGQHVPAAEGDPAPALQHRDDHRGPGRIQAGDRPPAAAPPRAGDQRLQFHRHGRRPCMVIVAQVPGTAAARPDRNSPDGSVSPTMPSLHHLEAADLVGRAEPVLHAADQPQRRVPVALEVQHHVDQVLEHPRPGDAAVLGDVADQHAGDVPLLGDRRSAPRRQRGPG